MRETSITSRDIFKGRVVHLQVHTVMLPDGAQAERELIVHVGAVAVVAVTPERDVLLVRQYRIGPDNFTLEVPAGLLEANEDPRAAATRELREETGMRPVTLDDLGVIHVSPGYTTERIHLFLADGVEPDPLPQDDDEFVELVRMPFATALAQIDNGELNEAKTIVALLKAARRLGL